MLRRRAEAAVRSYLERVPARCPPKKRDSLDWIRRLPGRGSVALSWFLTLSEGTVSRIRGPADTQETDTGSAALDTRSARSNRSKSAAEQTEAAARFDWEAPCENRE